MKESAGSPRKTSLHIQALANIGFLASLLDFGAAVEAGGVPEGGSQSGRLAAELRGLLRQGAGTDEPERTF
ncbi:MAG TPA: hypothetical protein VMB03_09565 [Bryobacteraceae bacterium]|nr:hypothetical protein [Bryobacteraceae bacterium]